MSSRHTRTVRLFAAVSAAAVVLSGVVVLQVVMAGVRDAGTDADAAAGIVRNVLFALLALGVVLVGVAIVAGRAFARALRSLRELALARARGASSRSWT
jgi:asparagine N-glycosylation enzyme membrane subunit Stt3